MQCLPRAAPTIRRTARRTALVFCVSTVFGAGQAGAQSPNDGFDPGANNLVLAFAIQADGRILVGGAFTALGGGGTGSIVRNHIGRLNVDGSIDATFNPAADERVYALAIQSDGKIVVGGVFDAIAGSTAISGKHIARLNADGTLDGSFAANANGPVYALAPMPDGRLVVGGAFTTIGDVARNRLARLNADGSVDRTFDPGANESVSALALQADGDILVGGSFTALDGAARQHLGRIHADGTLDASFNAAANERVRTIGVHADGRIVVGGYFTMLGGAGTATTARSHIGRFNPNGVVDTSFDPGANQVVQVVTVQTDGGILVGGDFTMLGGGGSGVLPRAHLGRLQLNGSIDTTFNPGADGAVYALAEQPDRGILIGGLFTTLGSDSADTPAPPGKAPTSPVTPRSNLGRTYFDGRVDVDFSPLLTNYQWTVAILPNGDMLVGGDATTPLNAPAPALQRIHADGTIDRSFTPSINGAVYAIAVQPDGKILIGGGFQDVNSRHSTLARLNADGTLDFSFIATILTPVTAVVIQPDGKILVGGQLYSVNGELQNSGVVRLNADGSIDPSFVCLRSTFACYDADGAFDRALTLQPDGKFYWQQRRHYADGPVEQGFPQTDGCAGNVTVRPDNWLLVALGHAVGLCTPDGTLQARIDLPPFFFPYQTVQTLGLQTDGRTVFPHADSSGSARISRLTGGLSIDDTFQPIGGSGIFSQLSIQPDGKVVAVGTFSVLYASVQATRTYVARLSSTDAATQNLAASGVGHVVLTWMRGGAGPEVWRTTFERSTDGIDYTALGEATRVPGGWRLTNVLLPPDQNVWIRARAYYSFFNSSTSIVESVRNVYLREAFTDDTLGAGVSAVRAVHITELRDRIDAQRVNSGLAPFAWTDATLSPALTTIKAQHVLDLREALRQVYVARSMAPPAYTDPALLGVTVKATHIQQLRTALHAIE